MAQRHNVVREGVIAGVIGATAVAVWFLVIDMVKEHALYTPDKLGAAVLDVFGPRGMEGVFAHVLTYTIVHYAAFILVGIIVSVVVNRAEREPSVLALFLVLFVVVEMLFYGAIAVLNYSGLLGYLAWYQVGAANLIAALLMGTYMWRLHPALRQEFVHALSGKE